MAPLPLLATPMTTLKTYTGASTILHVQLIRTQHQLPQNRQQPEMLAEPD